MIICGVVGLFVGLCVVTYHGGVATNNPGVVVGGVGVGVVVKVGYVVCVGGVIVADAVIIISSVGVVDAGVVVYCNVCGVYVSVGVR